MQNVVLSVTLEDGTTYPEVKVKPGDVVRFERHFGIRLAGGLDEPSLEQVLYLAWAPLSRTQSTALDFDTFCDQVENVDIVSAGAAVPSPPAP